MGGTPLTPFMRDRIRRLCREGWTAPEIARETGRGYNLVRKVLRDAGLDLAAKPQNPIKGYSPPSEDYDDLTPLQREERIVSSARAFEARVDYEMTEESARRDVGMGTVELARRDKLTVAEARYVQRRATEFLRTLYLARKGEEA